MKMFLFLVLLMSTPVQTFSGDVSTTTKTVTFSSTPTSGNILILGFFFSADPGTITKPSTWAATPEGTVNHNTGSGCWGAMFYKKNCPTTNGESWSWVNSVSGGSVVGAEYSGCDTVSPLNKHNSGTGNSSNLVCDPGGLDFLNVVIFGQSHTASAPSFSSPTNNWVIEVQHANAAIGAFVDAALLDSGNPSQASVTSSQTDDYVGLAATFVAPGAPSVNSATFTLLIEQPHQRVPTIYEAY